MTIHDMKGFLAQTIQRFCDRDGLVHKPRLKAADLLPDYPGYRNILHACSQTACIEGVCWNVVPRSAHSSY